MSTAITPSSPEVSLARRAVWAEGQAISFLMQQGVENPDCLSLAAGLVDSATLPVDIVRQAAEVVLGDANSGREALQYGHTAGSEKLRRLIRNHLDELERETGGELNVDLDQIILTQGSQQFLSLVAQVLLDPGDICLVAAPTYFVFLGTLAGVGARAIPVETDENGMKPDSLIEKLEEIEAAGESDRVKLIYLVSDFENPSGFTLTADRREQIVAIAEASSTTKRIHILEDAAYRELRYDGEPLPSVRSSDKSGQSVLYAGTFSKSFSPGLRVGFGIVPKSLVEPIRARKGNEDFGSAHLNQQLLATVLGQDWYRPHAETVRQGYRTKRDALLSGIEEHFTDLDGVSWMRPEGGLYVWMTLPPYIETGFGSPLFKRAAKFEHVMYVPGELCHGGEPEEKPTNQMRLSFGVLDPANLKEAAVRLARAVRHSIGSFPDPRREIL